MNLSSTFFVEMEKFNTQLRINASQSP